MGNFNEQPWGTPASVSTRHITQEELAAALGVRQPSVSRLEHGDDAKLSTLRAYVEALGGRLELAAVFDDDERFPLAV